MPRPTEPGQRYVAGLDGIRALAVTAVIIYHLGVPGAGGGMLGVGVFFTLSGYLITEILLTHWDRTGKLGLGNFWLRRARRLLPALFLLLAIVTLYVALFDAAQLAAVRRQVLAAAVYISNWVTIAQHGSYFSRFSAPLPLDHLWSLSIEEQFYLVWPWLLMVGLWLARGRRMLAGVTLLGALASVIAMGVLYRPGYDPTRVYEGTDTRAFGLLIGAALAMLWPSAVARARSRRHTRPAVRLANLLDGLGAASLLCIVLLVFLTTPFSSFLYPYGFLLLSLATAAILAAVVYPTTRMARALGHPVLGWVGVRSYGIYLWQWPVIVLMNPSQSGFNLLRAILEIAVTVGLAALSWRYVEDPIRHGALGRLLHRIRTGTNQLIVRRRVIAVSSTAGVGLLVIVLGLAGALPAASRGHVLSAAGPLLKRTQSLTDPNGRAAKLTGPPPKTTSCQSVVYIGDSTSEGETSATYITNPRRQLVAQLEDVGVKSVIPEISGARSIVEVFEGLPNAATVAQQEITAGFRGCWILALGTNDVADVEAGSNTGLQARIAQMMSIIGNEPVLWIAAVTLDSSGAYAESGMQKWNQDLLSVCSRYPYMRVFNWPALAKPKWFIPDGIHYYTPGYIARSYYIPKALVRAFPAGESASPGCVVS